MSRTVQILLIAVNILFWVPILAWTVFADHPYDPPDHLSDATFAAAAEPICAIAQSRIAGLGLPTEVDSPEARAQLTDDGNDILRGMLVELGDLPRRNGEEASWITEWLADWDTHIADRQDWADDLSNGIDRPFTETARAGFQISRQIDNFAKVNLMLSCKTTGDV